MKLLIAVKAMPGESSGPISRARALAAEAMKRGHEVAFCAGEDQNYRPVEGVKNFFAPVPASLFEAYRDIVPISPGFAHRRELWRLATYLAVISVDARTPFGRQQLARLADAIRLYA